MEFYERIRNAREDKDEKQEAIAKYLGITRQQYGLYETGQREFKIAHIIKLCMYFDLSSDFILGLPEGMPYGHSKTKKTETRKGRSKRLNT